MTKFPTVTIRAISDVVTKGTTPTSLGRAFVASGVRFIKVETIASNGKYLPGKVAYIDAVTHNLLKRSQLKQDDILFSIAGALGRTTIVEKSWLPANTNQAFAIIRPSKRNGIDSRYLLWALRSQAIGRHISEINVQAAQANLSLEQVRDFEIPLPNIEIQKQISDALDDVEELVATLDRLIIKKQTIKQGMMQQLLTGKTRLPGFDNPWRQSTLSEVLTVRHGRSQHDIERSDGLYPILATGGEIGRTDTPLYSKPSVLIGRKGTIDRPQYRDEPFWTVDTLFYTEIHEPNVPKYVYYLFLTIDWRSKNEASGVPSLSSSSIENISAVMPGFEEQSAIAKVLTNADAEIHLLETRLAKAKFIKLGMMQELLTGQTRLKPAEAGV